MALDRDKLYDGINNIGPNASIADAADKFAQVFVAYYADALAGDSAPTLVQSTLSALFAQSMQSNQFLEKLGTNLQAFFLTVGWISTAFIGAPGTTLAIGPVLDAQLQIIIQQALLQQIEDPTDSIATAIHQWSTSNITVTLTNNQSGATSVVPII